MAQRERTKNPCAHCGHTFANHDASGTCLAPDHDAIHCPCPGYVESRIFRASPSSVENAGKCWRKWASRALGGISKEDEARAFGTRLHAIAEDFLLTRNTPDQTTKEGRLFNEGIPFLPKRKLLPEEIEGEVKFTFEGVPWIGYYDWKLFAERQIGDHKTSSDPKRWGLTAADLPTNLQACTYAYDSGWPETNLRWVYYGKKSKNAYPVDATVSRQQATDVLGKFVSVTKEMQKWFNENPKKLTIAELNEIPNNPDACDGVGRFCDFGEDCLIRKPRTLVPVGNTMAANAKVEELRARLAAKKAGATVAVNPPESEAALDETAKEVAGEKAAPADGQKIETTVAPQADTPKEQKKPKVGRTAPADETEGLPRRNSIEGLVEHLAAFAGILPAGVTITINLTPPPVAVP